MQQTIKTRQQRQFGLMQTLQAVSPLATLDRGYAIVQRQKESGVLKSAEDIQLGDSLAIRLAKGRVIAEVKKTFLDDSQDSLF
jgi:exodeoxyribonuclease VII large subunit